MSSATKGILDSPYPRVEGKAQVLMIVAASPSGSTAKVAKVIADELGARMVGVEDGPMEGYDGSQLLGFGSGIFQGAHHPALLGLVDGLPPMPGAKAFIFSTNGMPVRLASAETYSAYVPKTNAALRDRLLAKGFEIVGEFGCPGFNDNKFLKYFGGLNKGRPNDKDLDDAREFARGLPRGQLR